MLPDTDAEELLAELQKAMGRRVALEVLLTAPPAPPSPTDHPVFDLLVEVLGAEAPVVPYFTSGVTDSRFFRERGIPAYGVTPFVVGPQDLMGIHGPDESIPVDELMAGVGRMEALARAWAFGE
jgi:carboxypeptidase PM20D1